MRTMTKKCGVYAALAAALLVTVALVMGCIEPVDALFSSKPNSVDSSDSQASTVIPEGMGAIKLSVNDGNNARTITPDTPTITTYAVTFTRDPDGINSGDPGPEILAAMNINAAAITNLIVLDPDEYSVSISASTADGVVATGTAGTATPFEVTADNAGNVGNAPTDVQVTLAYPSVTATTTGSGKFNYAITAPATVTLTTSSMVITEITAGGDGSNPPAGSYVLGSNTITLDPGYYSVDFTLIDDATPPHTVGFRQILHIYQNLTSEYTYVFTDSLFPTPARTDGDVALNITLPDIPGGLLGVTTSGGDLTGDSTDGYILTLSTVTNAGGVTLTAQAGSTDHSWRLGGTEIGTGTTLNIAPGNATYPVNPGVFILSVDAIVAGVPVSAQLTLYIVTTP